ncbi:MAG: hypothetical protein IIV04_03190 [Bacteroidaceae bacterium]|nr:hypothetical protein [Bacteroidaceae bacterium]
MRKNLFLTLALAFASFAGVNAQGWSLSLGAGDGLPGENVKKGAETVQVYKSDVITPSEPLTTLRFTVALNYNGEKPNGNNYVTALSELVVYAADGETVIPYTATSNADMNTSGGGTDGAGIEALNDGKWNNYWHSCWSATGAQADYHHLELTFEAPVSEFILEWGARPGNPKNAPLLVGLTKGGVDYVPYSDWAFTVGNEITSMEALKDVKYFVMKSNVPVEYDVYINNHNSTEGKFGDKTNKEPVVGPGPLYVAPGVQDSIVAPSYAIQLIKAEGGYFLYYVAEGKFLSKNPTDNAYNGANGGQGKTAKMSDAAIVNIEEVNGRFEMSYMMEYEGEEVEIHLGATPSTGGFKNVDKERYEFYKEGYPYCLNYAYILAFDWTLQEITMNYPAKYASVPVRNAIKEAKSIYTYMDSVAVEDYEEAYENFMDVLAEAEENLEAGAYTDIETVFADVEALNEAMGRYVYSKIEWFNEVRIDELEEYDDMCTGTPQPGYYLSSAYKEYIEKNLIGVAEDLLDAAEDSPYDYLSQMKTFINSIESNLNSFLATYVTETTLPAIYTAEDPHRVPLGAKVNDGHGDGRYDWEQPISLAEGETVDGIRLTFLETNVGGAASDGKFHGFPMVALSGLEILDNTGRKLALTAELVTSNSEETAERENGNGTIDKLFDNDQMTYYHSAWGDGARYDQPYTYIYLDVKFPEGVKLNTFTVRTIGRTNQAKASLAPGTVCITKYGEVYDPAIFRPNPYNVAGGKQVTELSEIEEGVYILSGNLRVKTKHAAPRFYSGAQPYHTDIKAALNDPCVYYFKKTANGWNIISLSKAQFWALNKDEYKNFDEELGDSVTTYGWSTGLTVYPTEAAEIKIAKSGNLENTFVFYSEIGDNMVDASWYWKNPKDEVDTINIETAQVNANKFVFMDWDGNLAGRPCVSEIPGEFTYGLDVINARPEAEEFKNGDGYSAGDYLHFNKANGEGEWNIYKVTMDDMYLLWANGIPATLAALNLMPGKDPGCLEGEIAALEAAVEKIEDAVEFEDAELAEMGVKEFVENVEMAKTADRVPVKNNYWYAIESAFPKYYELQNKTKAIYAGEGGLRWKDAPAAYNRETAQFVFQFQQYDGVNDPDGFGIPADDAEYVYRIYSDYEGAYLCNESEKSVQITFEKEKDLAGVYVVRPLETNIYTIKPVGVQPLHTAGHGEGSGGEGTVVLWEGGVGTASSWILRFVDDAKGTSVEDLVVEGAEVVSVAYFTPAGAAIPAPVSGINIVVTVYSNGVIETKKVLVK